jgi:hypothetical protein
MSQEYSRQGYPSLPPSEAKSFASATSSTTTGQSITESKSPLSRPVPKTEDDGDCAFHAVLGVWNEKEQRIICAEAKQRRAEVKRAIEESKMGSRIHTLAVAGIRELIMTGRSVGKESRQLLQKHQRFLADQDALSPQLWQAFEIELRKYRQVVDHIAGLNHDPKGTAASLREQFYDALNRNDGELYAIIRSLTDLDAAFKHYNELAQTTYDWEGAVSSEVIAEYAQFVGRPGQWLLPSEVAILAEVFHITVEYYSAPGAQAEIINSNQQHRVVVQFNGTNHFEQIQPASKPEQKASGKPSVEKTLRPQLQINVESLRKTLGRISDATVKKIVTDTLKVFEKRIQDFNENAQDPTISDKTLGEDIVDLEGLIENAKGNLEDHAADKQSKKLASEVLGQLTQGFLKLSTQPPYKAILQQTKLTSNRPTDEIDLYRLRKEQQLLFEEPSPLNAAFNKALEEVRASGLPDHKPPKGVFICYAWPDIDRPQEQHLSWLQPFLAKLRDHLKAAGLGSTILDIRDNPVGGDISQYMNAAKESNYVLLIGTESLLRKHKEGGAVRTELIHIMRKLKEDRQKNLYRVIPILLSGTPETAFPAEYELYNTIQFWDETSYFVNFRRLIASLYGVSKPAIDSAFKVVWAEFLTSIKDYSAVVTAGLSLKSVNEKLVDEKAKRKKDQEFHHQTSQELLKLLTLQGNLSNEYIRQTDPHTPSSPNSTLSTAVAKKELLQEEKSSSSFAKVPPSSNPLSSIMEAKTSQTQSQFVLGSSDFKKVVENKGLIVDKSLFIKDIIDKKADVKLILRPRRFGKTFNLSMLYYFFDCKAEAQRNLFQNLNIWSVDGGAYQNYYGKHPVIFLTLKDIIDIKFENALKKFGKIIGKLYEQQLEKYSFKNKKDVEQIIDGTADYATLQLALQNLIEYLYKASGNTPVILLIDEYDTPLNVAYNNTLLNQLEKEKNKFDYEEGYYAKMVNFMRSLLGAALKDSPYLHCAVLTGILRVSKESIFSGLNNITMYSVLNDDFSAHFGFSRKEVQMQLQHAFGPKADETLLNRMEDEYGGYQVGECCMFSPWAVASFIEANRQCAAVGKPFEYKDYWLNTSGNELITDLLDKADTSIKDEFKQLLENQPIVKKIAEHTVFGDIKKSPDILWNLLLLSGYLTIHPGFVNASDPTKRALVIPNQKLYTFYEEQFKKWLQKTYRSYQLPGFKNSHWLDHPKRRLSFAHTQIGRGIVNEPVFTILLQAVLEGDEEERNTAKELFIRSVVLDWLKQEGERLKQLQQLLKSQEKGVQEAGVEILTKLVSAYQLVVPNQEIHNFYEAQIKTWLVEETKKSFESLMSQLSPGITQPPTVSNVSTGFDLVAGYLGKPANLNWLKQNKTASDRLLGELNKLVRISRDKKEIRIKILEKLASIGNTKAIDSLFEEIQTTTEDVIKDYAISAFLVSISLCRSPTAGSTGVLLAKKPALEGALVRGGDTVSVLVPILRGSLDAKTVADRLYAFDSVAPSINLSGVLKSSDKPSLEGVKALLEIDELDDLRGEEWTGKLLLALDSSRDMLLALSCKLFNAVSAAIRTSGISASKAFFKAAIRASS